MFPNVLNHLPIVGHLVPICYYYGRSLMGIHPKEMMQKEKKKKKPDAQRRCTTFGMTEGRPVLHLKLMRLQTKCTPPHPKLLLPQPLQGTSQCSFHLPSSPALEVHSADVFPARPSPPVPYGPYSCQRDLPRHGSVMPQTRAPCRPNTRKGSGSLQAPCQVETP